MDDQELSGIVLNAVFKVHSHLGPRLFEGAYQKCLVYGLAARGLSLEVKKRITLINEKVKLHHAFRIAILAENSLIIELKAVDQLRPVHTA